MLDRIISLFRPRRAVMARFNAASRSEDSQRNFSGTDFLSADAAMSQDVRRLIAARARNEFANNSFAYGIVFTLADDTIGTGPRLQLESPEEAGSLPDLSADPALQRRERRFRDWSRQVNLNSLLRCARIAKAVDGETFIRLQVNRASRREVPLEPRIYEAEYVSSERMLAPTDHHDSGQPIEVDGIIYDAFGNPVYYRFWRTHPGSVSSFSKLDSQPIPAWQVIHYANRFRAGQHRGLSEMTAALHIFNDLRRYSTAVVKAAEVAARLSFVISNDLPPEMFDATVKLDEDGSIAQTALDIQGGPSAFTHGDFNSLVLPAGYTAGQLKSEQPTQNYVSFKDSKIAEAARVFSMPFNIAAGNSSSYNYASGRLDHQVYHKKLLIERETIGTEILDPLFSAWEEYDAALHPEDYHQMAELSHSWMWDGFEHVDPVKESRAQAERLANGVTTLAEECAREGRDYHNVLRQRQREVAECRRLGLDPLGWMTSNQAASQESTDDDGDGDDTKNNQSV